MGLSEGREAENSSTGPLLPMADFIIDTPHGASGGVVGRVGDLIMAGSPSSYTRSPHLFQLLETTINTNIPTSLSAFQGRKALMRIYCPVVVTVWTPWHAGRNCPFAYSLKLMSGESEGTKL